MHSLYIFTQKDHMLSQAKMIDNMDMDCTIRVITKLTNSEQSNKGKVKTHKYINR